MGTPAGVAISNKVAGWEGFMLKNSLESSQLTEAIMGLPTDHPAHKAMMQGWRSLVTRR